MSTGDPLARSDGEPRVVVYGKPGCHLCDVAEQVIAQVCGATGEPWRRVDISADDELMHTYGELLPVTFVDGSQHDYWRVDPARLHAALAR
jgi:hypothetical protein